MLNPGLCAEHEKHFDRFGSRPRRGTLDVTVTLFTEGVCGGGGGGNMRGGLSLLEVPETKGVGGEASSLSAHLPVSSFVLTRWQQMPQFCSASVICKVAANSMRLLRLHPQNPDVRAGGGWR